MIEQDLNKHFQKVENHHRIIRWYWRTKIWRGLKSVNY